MSLKRVGSCVPHISCIPCLFSPIIEGEREMSVFTKRGVATSTFTKMRVSQLYKQKGFSPRNKPSVDVFADIAARSMKDMKKVRGEDPYGKAQLVLPQQPNDYIKKFPWLSFEDPIAKKRQPPKLTAEEEKKRAKRKQEEEDKKALKTRLEEKRKVERKQLEEKRKVERKQLEEKRKAERKQLQKKRRAVKDFRQKMLVKGRREKLTLKSMAVLLKPLSLLKIVAGGKNDLKSVSQGVRLAIKKAIKEQKLALKTLSKAKGQPATKAEIKNRKLRPSQSSSKKKKKKVQKTKKQTVQSDGKKSTKKIAHHKDNTLPRKESSPSADLISLDDIKNELGDQLASEEEIKGVLGPGMLAD